MAVLAGLTFAVAAAPACAQDLRVRLLNEETREPLAGVLVAALGDNAAVGPTVLATGDGVVTVRVTGAGPYRLLIRRIGFAPVTTEPVTASAAGETLDVLVPLHRITLGTVRVVGSASCSAQTGSPSAGAQDAWTQVRTALEASTLTRNQRLVTTAGYRIQRLLRTDGTVDYADTSLLGRTGERPFVAPPPAALERDGYFRVRADGSEEFYAPDEAVLLSPGFTAHHCVSDASVVRRDSTGTWIALGFVPRDRDTRSEIKGLIWIDSATSELRRIDFEYIRVPLPAPADSLGGSVEFRHLASGAWIVSKWMLRIPRWRVADRRAKLVLLDGYSEVGGVASVLLDIATPGPNVPRVIAGIVFDSIAQRPLRRAHVHLADLNREAVADSSGAFRFDSVGAGVHTVWADHPTLDTLGLFSLGASVDVTPRIVNDVSLAIPSFATLRQRVCGAATPADSTAGFVFGAVHSDSAGASRPGAVVSIGWRADSTRGTPKSAATAMADSTGNYVVCGVPGARDLMISARDGAIATPPVALRLGAARIVRRDLVLSAMATVAEGVADTVASAGNGTPHLLRVISADGKPVVYANVSLSGGTVRITNDRGEVSLGPGRIYAVTTSVKRIGFKPWFGTIDFPDAASVVTVTLTHVAQYLAEVKITGQKNPSSPFVQGFYDRWMMRQKGLLSATFIGPEEIEFRHPDMITNVLRGVLGVQFQYGGADPLYYVAYSTDAPNCPMAVVIDGIQQYPEHGMHGAVETMEPVYINQRVSANDVMAVEVYARGANMPISLQVNDTRCGVIAIWTGSRR